MTRRRDYPRRPKGVDVGLWRAYGHRFPGSGQRWLDQKPERDWLAPKPASKGSRTCQTCGQPYGGRHHGIKFCSIPCYQAGRQAARLARPVPSHAEVVAEMVRALATHRQWAC